MLHIGCHLSSSKGFLHMGKAAQSIQADTFQFFTRNPRGGAIKDLDEADAAALARLLKDSGFTRIVAHAPYTLNACGAEGRVREFAREVMREDLRRMEYLPGNLYNIHPGSHVGQGISRGVELIAELLNELLDSAHATTVLLETMAGKGSEVGGRFEELRDILGMVCQSEKLGVCLDTCHVYDAGYDIVQDLDGVLSEFDTVIGLGRLKAVHLNDSKNPFASHKDRHEKIGEGSIGFDTMVQIINHPKLKGLPIILETPNELDGYAKEIEMLRNAYKG